MSVTGERASPSNGRRCVAVILNWNGAADTIACCASLRRCGVDLADMLIVDNASSDESVAMLRASLPGVRIVTLSSNRGYAGGNNEGIRAVLVEGYDRMFVLNNDTIVEPGCLEALHRELDTNPTFGVATPKILYLHDSTLIYAAGGSENVWVCSGVADLQGQRDRDPGAESESSRSIAFASGCALMIRREVFEAVGLFDERFFMYFEDLEFSARVRERFALRYVPQARLLHRVGAGTSWAAYSPLYQYYYTRNRMWYFSSRGPFLRAYVILFSLVVSIAKAGALLWAWFSAGGPSLGAKAKWQAMLQGFIDGLRPWSVASDSIPDVLRSRS